MKKIRRFSIMALGALALMTTACEDAKKDAIGNLVYFSEATTAKTKVISLEEEVTLTSLTVRLAQAIGSRTDVTVNVDKQLLESYNKKYETDYQLLDQEKFSFKTEATIEAGSVSSAPMDIEIQPFEPLGVKYAIPLSISSVKGSVEKSDASSKIILFLEKPLKQQVPSMTWYNGSKCSPADEDWGIELPNYTLEWWCRISNTYGTGGYSKNNQAVFDSGSSATNLYIRFGDLVYGNVFNYLQVKTMGSQFDSGDPNQGFGLTPMEWVHWAVTYDAASGTTLMYKNGVAIASLSTTAGVPMKIDKVKMVSSGATYFPDMCQMCQVRFWKTTRSANQIKNNMYGEVDPKNTDLLLYLPMNEGPGATVFHDVTGNGHDVEIGNMYPDSSNRYKMSWSTYTFAQ